MRYIQILGFLGGFLTPFWAAAAEIVILESTAPGVEAGAIVQDSDPVDVPDGTMLLIVEEDGTTREIAGPFNGPIGSAGGEGNGGGLIANLGKLVKDRETKRQVLGAIRAAPGQVPPDLYLIDAARSGTVCIPAGDAPVLWRPLTMAAETEVNLDGDEQGHGRFVWTGASQTADWPVEVTLSDGAAYALRLGLAPRPTELVVRLIPAEVTKPPARAAWMYEAGCRRQAVLLVENLQ